MADSRFSPVQSRKARRAMNGASGARASERASEHSFARGDRLSNGTQIKITFAESGEKMADFPRQRRRRTGGRVVREGQAGAREEPGKRKVRHDRRRWPARRLSRVH